MNITIVSKQERYSKLVEKRKDCRLCGPLGLTNPSECEGGVYDNTGHIGPWTQWQGNLDARVMVIAQDWGGKVYYVNHRGLEEDDNTTNRRIRELLASVNIQIKLPPEQQDEGPLFFTNAVLCLKPGLLTGPVKSSWFSNCATNFLRPQVELVNPKVVVTLGYMAYRSLMRAYALPHKALMREAVQESVRLPRGNVLVPMYHPGNNGTRSRSFENQKTDWQHVRKALEA
jgi:uracil-DNA glycosylase family 4